MICILSVILSNQFRLYIYFNKFILNLNKCLYIVVKLFLVSCLCIVYFIFIYTSHIYLYEIYNIYFDWWHQKSIIRIMVNPNKNGKTLRISVQQNSNKPISLKQACNGNCQSCNITCSIKDPAIECIKCHSRLHSIVVMWAKMFMIYLKTTKWSKWDFVGSALNLEQWIKQLPRLIPIQNYYLTSANLNLQNRPPRPTW